MRRRGGYTDEVGQAIHRPLASGFRGWPQLGPYRATALGHEGRQPGAADRCPLTVRTMYPLAPETPWACGTKTSGMPGSFALSMTMSPDTPTTARSTEFTRIRLPMGSSPGKKRRESGSLITATLGAS